MGIREVKLTKNAFAIVDEDDFEKINKYKWHLSSTGYAHRQNKMIKGIRKGRIMMHRIIVNCPENKVVDHINGNKLDNRKSNLRICTYAQNLWNTKIFGITFLKNENKWQVRCQNNGKRMFLGSFIDINEALKRRRDYIKNTRGQYANI